MIVQSRTRFKCNITKEKIVNRLKTLKDIMHLALDALKKSGISWNDTTKKIEAGPETWNELIKVWSSVSLMLIFLIWINLNLRSLKNGIALYLN